MQSDKLEILSRYLTWNRVLSVISKFGQPTDKDFGAIARLTLQDAREEAERIEHISEISPFVSKILYRRACTVLRSRWRQVVKRKIT